MEPARAGPAGHREESTRQENGGTYRFRRDKLIAGPARTGPPWGRKDGDEICSRPVRHCPYVGNYGESFERNVGQGSPLELARGRDALWTKGGLHYPVPMR